MAKSRKAIALLLAVLMVFSLLPMMVTAENTTGAGEPVWPNPGSIHLSKRATQIGGEGGNLWEVVLSIQGMNYESTSDVVLVIDCSGSMGEGSKLNNTRIAAKAFGEQLLTADSSTRIAIVTYTDTATKYENGKFYAAGELNAFKDAVEAATYANGGTNQQAGLYKAQELLASDASTGNLKNIVILSDGEATFSHPFKADATYSDCMIGLLCPLGGKITNIGAFKPNYDEIIGSGSGFALNYNAKVTATCPKHGNSTTRDYVYALDGTFTTNSGTNNGVATIWEANQAKAAGTTIFSVALQAGTNGENTLKACATDAATGYFAIGTNDNVQEKLTSAFTQIAGSIAIAASNGTVVDPMGDGVQLSYSGEAPEITTDETVYSGWNADIYISQGSATFANGTIQWNVGNVTENANPTMKYRITLKEGTNPSIGTELPANGTTTFSYTNYLGNETSKDFEIPNIVVGGGNIMVHYYMVNAAGEPINDNGEVVDSPAVAKQVKEAAYWRNGESTALNYNTTYTLEKEDITDYKYYGKYILNDGALTEGNSVDVHITATNSNQHVWFAYKQVFTVGHVRYDETEKVNVITYSEHNVEPGFNLTAKVSEGFLYGGAFSDAACTTPQTFPDGQNAMSFLPTAGATYYIWEVDSAYLIPKNMSAWEHIAEGIVDVMGFFLVTPIDREYYQSVGFTIEKNGEKIDIPAAQFSESYMEKSIKIQTTDSPVVYNSITAILKDNTESTYTVNHFNMKDRGYLGCISVDKSAYWNTANAQFSFTPYWVTLDGIQVTSATTRTMQYNGSGSGADVNYKKLVIASTQEGQVNISLPTTPETIPAEPMRVYSNFLAASVISNMDPVTPIEPEVPVLPEDPEDPEDPVDPVEPEDPEEPVLPEDPENPAEPEEDTITVTVCDNGNVYDIALLPGDISGEIEYLGAAGSLFAGWYTDEAYVEPADFTYVTEDITIYAKYVSDAYLQVQYMQNRLLRSGAKATLISAVDSDHYAETGFVINGETVAVSAHDGNSYFYDVRWLFGREVAKRAPILTAEISTSDYSIGDTIEVTPYWITMDGTTVYGASRTLTVARTGFRG